MVIFSSSERVDMVMLMKGQVDRDRPKRILQAEEQILERVEEEPDISTRRFAAEVGVSQFVYCIIH